MAHFPSPGEWNWPLLTPRALAAGISMALAASTSSLGCYALCGRLLHLPPPPPHACSRGLSLEGLGSVLAGLLGSPMGTASSFPNVGKVGLIQVCGPGMGVGWGGARGEGEGRNLHRLIARCAQHLTSTVSLGEVPKIRLWAKRVGK